MRSILLPLFFIYSFDVLGQNTARTQHQQDSLDVITAQRYLNHKFGTSYIRKHLKYSGHYLYTIQTYNKSRDSYNTEKLRAVTFEVCSQRSSPQRNTLIILLSNNDTSTIATSAATRFDIDNYRQGKTAHNLYFNQSYALELAKKYKFKKGITDWKIEIQAQKNRTSWEITSTLEGSGSDTCFSGSGETFSVNLKTGKFITASWIEGCTP